MKYINSLTFFLKEVVWRLVIFLASYRVSQKNSDPRLMGYRGHQKWTKDKNRVCFEKFKKFPFGTPCIVHKSTYIISIIYSDKAFNYVQILFFHCVSHDSVWAI